MVEGAHGPAVVAAPRASRLKDGWRAAAKAFRSVYANRELTYNPMLDHAEVARKHVVPELFDREVMAETIAAIHYASVVAPRWLYALHLPEPRM